jgi:hypothetical protein
MMLKNVVKASSVFVVLAFGLIGCSVGEDSLNADAQLLSNTAASKTIFVDETNGVDTNDGLTRAKPVKLLSTAADKALPGDTVKILPGTYRYFGTPNAYSALYVPRSGTPGKYITYLGVSDANGKKPVIESSAWSAFVVQGKSYIVIDNLEFKPAETDYLNLKTTIGDWAWPGRVGVRIQDDSHNVIVKRNYIHDFPNAGIAVSDSDVVMAHANTLEHNAWGSNYGSSGISFYHMKDVANAQRFPEYPNHGVVITNNVSRYNIQLLGTYAFDWKITDGNGIIVDDFKHTQGGSTTPPYSSRTLIMGNRAFGNGGSGINVFQTNNVDMLNNSVFDNAQTVRAQNQPANMQYAQANQPVQVGGSANTLVANNIFTRSDSLTSMVSTFWNDDATITFKNNIFWNYGGQTSDVPAGNNNVVVNPKWKTATKLTQAQTNLLATVANIYVAEGASANVREPTLNNAFPKQNFALQSTSPAINAGVNLGYRTFVGTGVDIGALEYTP